ncbi:MAG: iron-sulfur cluster assembly scaffold protein [Actinomycetota bacterium]|nr:iron-sulfur cluster assembly scaffold protein [Actinomycetota bacterium]
MDRKQRLEFLVDHVKNPRHQGVLDGADVIMPGGSPECGGSVVIYLKGNKGGKIEEVAFTGEGDTLSMAGSSMILERVDQEGLTMEEVLALDYEQFVDSVGRDLVGSRTRNVTLGLSTLKAAVRKYQRDLLQNNSTANLSAAETV